MTPESAAAIVAGAMGSDPPAVRYVEHFAPGVWIAQTYDGRRHLIAVTVTSET